jgi:hypothetical protein
MKVTIQGRWLAVDVMVARKEREGEKTSLSLSTSCG